jgi:hypothetical protein
MARRQCPDMLTWVAAATNQVAQELKEEAAKYVPEEGLLYLEVAADSATEKFIDHGSEWLRLRIEEAMVVEVALLAAVDRSLALLMDLLRALSSTTDGSAGPVRELILLLLALRHEYLDRVIYGLCAALEPTAMEAVRCVVSSGSTLRKINGAMSSWSAMFGSHRKFLLIIDEVPGFASEEIAACLTEFDMVVLGGDKTQFNKEQKQNTNVSRGLRLGVKVASTSQPTRGPDPLNRHNGLSWAETLSKDFPQNAESLSSLSQFRYGRDTVNLIKAVFAPELSALECPSTFRRTPVIPWIFDDLAKTDEWEYAGRGEVLRSRRMFARALEVLAIEVVLAESRGVGQERCQVVVMWALHNPLDQLEALVDAGLRDACAKVHETWKIPTPAEGCGAAYNYESLKHTKRLQFKATSNAHGTNAEVAIWFLVRRKKGDRGLRGLQTTSGVLFEAMTRAKFRQHVFVEDLRESETLPAVEPFWTEGFNVGIKERWQFQERVTRSQGGRTLQALKVLSHCEEVVRRDLGLVPARKLHPHGPWSLPYFFRSPQCQRDFFEESVAGKRIFHHTWEEGYEKLRCHCETAYDGTTWPSATKKAVGQPVPYLQSTGHLLRLEDATSAPEWLKFWSFPQSHTILMEGILPRGVCVRECQRQRGRDRDRP